MSASINTSLRCLRCRTEIHDRESCPECGEVWDTSANTLPTAAQLHRWAQLYWVDTDKAQEIEKELGLCFAQEIRAIADHIEQRSLMNTTTDTPETDTTVVDAEYARRLERERNQARRRCDDFRELLTSIRLKYDIDIDEEKLIHPWEEDNDTPVKLVSVKVAPDFPGTKRFAPFELACAAQSYCNSLANYANEGNEHMANDLERASRHLEKSARAYAQELLDDTEKALKCIAIWAANDHLSGESREKAMADIQHKAEEAFEKLHGGECSATEEAASSEQDMRKAFEEWFEADSMPLEHSNWFVKDEDGDYEITTVYNAWFAWKAASEWKGKTES